MRLAHLADIHLGFRQYHRQTPTGINQREADVANAFRNAVDDIISTRPDVILIAGDLFHSVRPTNSAIIFAFRQFQRLREMLPEAKIIAVAGNHDTPRSIETGSILRLFAELGVEVITDREHRLVIPELDLSVLAVPHQALASGDRIARRREGSARHQLLLIHGEISDLPPLDRWWLEPSNALLDLRDLKSGGFDYVAMGHYHVTRELAPMIWYAGALEYVTANPWGELIEERKTNLSGKHWLLVDLERKTVEPRRIPLVRKVLDLKPIEARDLSAAEVDQEIGKRLGKIPGGLADQIVRLVVNDIPRHVMRELDHAAIRTAKATALHLHLDFRRPEIQRDSGSGAPGHRKTLPEMLHDFLERRPLPDRVNRERFVQRGMELLESTGTDSESG